jgi:DNA polymerase-3 subunit alpha (Gram-positive type)
MGNQDILIKEHGKKLKELICCRDDIMTFLISKGLHPELAFKIMESVRKGRKLKDE